MHFVADNSVGHGQEDCRSQGIKIMDTVEWRKDYVANNDGVHGQLGTGYNYRVLSEPTYLNESLLKNGRGNGTYSPCRSKKDIASMTEPSRGLAMVRRVVMGQTEKQLVASSV